MNISLNSNSNLSFGTKISAPARVVINSIKETIPGGKVEEIEKFRKGKADELYLDHWQGKGFVLTDVRGSFNVSLGEKLPSWQDFVNFYNKALNIFHNL